MALPNNRFRALSFACVSVVATAVAGPHFLDNFTTPPDLQTRGPFPWDRFVSGQAGRAVWAVRDGMLEYQADERPGRYAGFSLSGAGIRITDDTDWTMEVGFEHVAGTPPLEYEYVAYACWPAADAGMMRIVGLAYDAEQKQLMLYNASRYEPPVPVDLSGSIHRVRMAVRDNVLTLTVDGEQVAGPVALRLRQYASTPSILFGPLTTTKPHVLHCRWDYVAFSGEGAFAAGDPGWDVDPARGPVAEELDLPDPSAAFDHPDYPGIRLVRTDKGSARWLQAFSKDRATYREFLKTQPRQRTVSLYDYPDQPGPSVQNVYESEWVLSYDDRRKVGVAHMTRGKGDTATGFVDYKVWYRVSTDGGSTYSDLRPVVQRGDAYSPAHPVEYVHIGKNGFCYATMPGQLTVLSSGEMFLPCYYAPLDEHGRYYNPLGGYTFSWVFGLIGTWNEAGDDIVWEVSEPIKLDADQSSRGADECAVIELADKPGHVLMVIRGSNHPDPTGTLPACKWRTLSTDYGRTWSDPVPFTLDDGTAFLSPAACSNFIRSSRTGTSYWVGNLTRIRPSGNWPRYPLVMGELDEDSLSLRADTVTVIDDRRPGDPPDLQLSNFGVLEDPQTGHILVHLTRRMSAEAARDNPHAGPHTYVIDVGR